MAAAVCKLNKSVFFLAFLLVIFDKKSQPADEHLLMNTCSLVLASIETIKVSNQTTYSYFCSKPKSSINNVISLQNGEKLIWFIDRIRKVVIANLILQCNDISLNPGPTVSRPNNYRIAVLNARSLKSIHKDPDSQAYVTNLTLFQSQVYSEDYDIICVTETWLNESIFGREILPVGYDIFRRDRVRGTGGGVLIAAKSCLAIQRVQELESYDLETVAVSGAATNGKEILMAVCYRLPSSNSSWIESFENFVYIQIITLKQF